MMMSMQHAAEFGYLIQLPLRVLLDTYEDFRELLEEMKGG